MNGTSNRGGFTYWEVLMYFLLPAAIALATGRELIGRILAGGLFNPDSYMRLVRIEEMLQQHRTLDVVTRDGSGTGTLLHWSHLLDSALCLLAAPFTLVLDQHEALHLAASLLGPISIGLLGIAVAWAAYPLADRRWLWLAPVAVALSLPIVGYALPGVAHHHVLLVLVAVMTNGWALRAILGRAPRSAGPALGAWAGLGIWLSPETMPFILMAFAGTWLAWLKVDRSAGLEGRDIGAVIRSAGLAFLAVTGCAYAVDPPYAGYGSVEIDRLSVVYFTLALITFFLSVSTAAIDRARISSKTRMILGLTLPAAGLVLWIALFPAVIRGPSGLMSAQETHVFIDNITEMQPVTTVTGAVQFLLTGSVVAASLLWLALRRRSLLIGYVGLCAAVLVALGVMHLRFAAYPCAAGAVLLPILVRLISVSLAERSELLIVGARFALILPFVFALRVGGLPGFASPAKAAVEPALPNCGVGDLAPMLAPYAGQVVLADIDRTPELLYRTRILTVASLYHRNVAAFLRLRAAWRSMPSDSVPDAVVQTGASLVLACHSAKRSPLVADLSTDTLLDRLDRGEVPAWLEKVAEDKESGNMLYRVIQ